MSADVLSKRSPEELRAAYDADFARLKEIFGFDKIKQEADFRGDKYVTHGGELKELEGGAAIRASYRIGIDEEIYLKVYVGEKVATRFSLTNDGGLVTIGGDEGTPIAVSVGDTQAKVNQINGEKYLQLYLREMTKEGGLVQFEPLGVEFAEWIIKCVEEKKLLPFPVQINFPLIPVEAALVEDPDRDTAD